jgi:hypothetical protein
MLYFIFMYDHYIKTTIPKGPSPKTKLFWGLEGKCMLRVSSQCLIIGFISSPPGANKFKTTMLDFLLLQGPMESHAGVLVQGGWHTEVKSNQPG